MKLITSKNDKYADSARLSKYIKIKNFDDHSCFP